MTFRDVVIKNFSGNLKKYLAYFLCSSFSIMIFFMYSTLIFNKELSGRDDTEVLSYVFPITMVAISLFSVFFISYAHSAFIKGRNKEFGIYISLGMDSKELGNLINIENSILSGVSLVVGIAVGALLSRLFQMVILNILEIKNITYYLDYRAIWLTVTVFIIIFLVVIIITSIRMRRIDITSLLKEARRSEGKRHTKWDKLIGALGLIIMAASVFLLIIVAGNDNLNTNPFLLIIYMMIAFWGVYLTITYGGNFLLYLFKKSDYYYKNMLVISEIYYKFNQNKKIIFILSILSTMTIFLVASPFSLFRLSERIANMEKNHLEYVETSEKNKLSDHAIISIVGDRVKDYKKIKFIYLSLNKYNNNLKYCKPIIALDEYNSLTGNKISLKKGEASNVVLNWIPGTHGIEPKSELILYGNDIEYKVSISDSKRGEWITSMKSFPSNSIIVVNNEDYKVIQAKATNENIAYYHLFNFKNWKHCKEVVKDIKKQLSNQQLRVVSIIDTYDDLKRGYSVFLFVSTVMGILFFVAGGSVLYFKQYTELHESQITFHKLFKVGITDNEIRGVVAKELMIVFFLPLLFGSFLGVSLIYLMTFIVGGDEIIKEFISNALIVVLIYFISQGIFYFITKKKYVEEVIK